MRITFTFDGIPEMLRVLNLDKVKEYVHAAEVYSDIPGNDPAPDEFVSVPVKKTVEKKKVEEPKADKKVETLPMIDEKYRVEVRGVLAALNKKTGENTASKLIKEFGVAKLTDVALDDLPALMKKAQEALDA